MSDYDVIVLGTGGAGLTAAVTAAELGANVGLFEKGETVGGTTVYSGGMIWIPLNMHEPPEKGDTREQARAYLEALSNDTITPRWPRRISTSARKWCAGWTSGRRSSSTPSPTSPTTTPSRPAGCQQGGRSLETAAVPLRRTRRVEGPGPCLAVLPELPPHDRRDDARQGGPGAARSSGDAAPRRQRRTGHGARARRPPAEGLPRPRRGAAHRPPRRRADHGGRRGRRRCVRDGRGTQGGARAERRDRNRRLRAQPGAQARVPARPLHPHGRASRRTPATA